MEILGDDGRLYRYGHMQENSIPMEWEAGTRVNKDQRIGAMGATGNVIKSEGGDGGHLHFEAMLVNEAEYLTKDQARKPESYTRQEFDFTAETLDQTRGDDGFVNTQTYNELYEAYQADFSNGGKLFVEKFPPSEYLNPEDPTAKFFYSMEDEDDTASIDAIINDALQDQL